MAQLCHTIVEFAPDAIMQRVDLSAFDLSQAPTFCGNEGAIDARYTDLSRLRVRETVTLQWDAKEMAFVARVPVRIPLPRCPECERSEAAGTCGCRYLLDYAALEDVQTCVLVEKPPQLITAVGEKRRILETLLGGQPLTVTLHREGGSHTMDFLRSWERSASTHANGLPVTPASYRLSDRHWTVFRPSFRMNDGLLALARLATGGARPTADEKDLVTFLRRVLEKPITSFTVGADMARAVAESKQELDHQVHWAAYTAVVLLAKHHAQHDTGASGSRTSEGISAPTKPDSIVEVLKANRARYAFSCDMDPEKFKAAREPVQNIDLIAKTADVVVKSMYVDVFADRLLVVRVHPPPEDGMRRLLNAHANALPDLKPCLTARLVYVVKRA